MIQYFHIILSYFWEIPLKKYHSKWSGELLVSLINGKKTLNTKTVNYSYASLHRVFQTIFKKTSISKVSIRSILVLGLGGGSIIEILRKEYNNTSPITAVEIDPIIIEIAKSDFNILQYEPLNLVCSDVLDFISQPGLSFDFICVDIFINESVPDPFLQNKFMDSLIEMLPAGGHIYFNIMLTNSVMEEKASNLKRYLASLVGNNISRFQFFQLEENNVVLVVSK